MTGGNVSIEVLKKIEQIVAENVKSIREKRGLNQDSLAEKADLSKSTIAQLETAVKYPRKDTVEAVAAALEVPVSQLFFEKTDALTPSAFEVFRILKSFLNDRQSGELFAEMIDEFLQRKKKPQKAELLSILASVDEDELRPSHLVAIRGLLGNLGLLSQSKDTASNRDQLGNE